MADHIRELVATPWDAYENPPPAYDSLYKLISIRFVGDQRDEEEFECTVDATTIRDLKKKYQYTYKFQAGEGDLLDGEIILGNDGAVDEGEQNITQNSALYLVANKSSKW